LKTTTVWTYTQSIHVKKKRKNPKITRENRDRKSKNI